MRRFNNVLALSVVATIVLGTVPLAHGVSGVVFREKWDGYVNDAAMTLVWPNGTSTVAGTLDTTRFVSAPQSLKHPGGPSVRYHIFASEAEALTPTDANPILFKFRFYEDGATNKRFSGTLLTNFPRDATNGGWIEFGVYNAEPQDQYWARTVSIGGPNWFAVTGTARNRSTPGWRSMRMELGATYLRLSVDGAPNPAHQVAVNVGTKKFRAISFGSPSDVSSTGGGGNFDDIHVSYLSDENAGPQCTDVPPVTIDEILYAGKTTVNVSNVDAAATKVTVYANGAAIGSSTAAPFGSTVAITVPALVNGQTIVATQNKDITIVGFPMENIEGCLPLTGRVVGACAQIPAVSIGNILAAGMTTVKVTGINPAATAVTVYKNGAAPAIGTGNPGGAAELNVTVSALVAGDKISATQTIQGIEGCIPSTGSTVGACDQVPVPTIVGVPGAGDTQVTVGGLDPAATQVRVYANGAGPAIGTVAGGAAIVYVPVPALAAGTVLSATQTLNGIEGCIPATGKTVRTVPGLIEDFEGTFTALDNPVAPVRYSVWYDASNVAYSTASVVTYFGSKAMKIDDPGYTNGVYAIYQGVVPATGQYHLQVQMMVDERTAGANLDFLKTLQVGVVVNGAHRDPNGKLDPIVAASDNGVGSYPGPLTALQDGPPNETEFYVVLSSTFTAQAGDSLLIAFATDVNTFNQNGASTGAYFVVDNIILKNGPKPASCSDVPAVTVTSAPLEAGATGVEVGNLHQAASMIKIWAGDGTNYTQIGSANPSGATNFLVPTSPLQAGQFIRATQVVDLNTGNGPQESCIVRDGPVVGSGQNSPLLVTLGVREVAGATGPVGADGGNSGTIEWIGASAKIVDAPLGKKLETDPGWQLVTFTPATDPKVAFSGNGTLDVQWAVFENLAFTITTPYNTGHYAIQIDSIYNGTTLLADFDDTTAFPAGQPAMFRKPATSGTTAPNILAAPDTAQVVAGGADGSAQSVKVEWQFSDSQTKRWLRLTTDGTGITMPLENPLIDLSQPITMKLRLYGAPSGCGPVFADSDKDGDVDMADFAALQRCINIGAAGLAPECGCFDRPFDGVIGADDLTSFHNCASGAGVPADPACDD